jgi:hypothetical protein
LTAVVAVAVVVAAVVAVAFVVVADFMNFQISLVVVERNLE